jgi:hypothetical protein
MSLTWWSEHLSELPLLILTAAVTHLLMSFCSRYYATTASLPSAATTWQKPQHPISTRGWPPLRPMSPSLATRRRLKSLSNRGLSRGSV